MRPQDPRDTPQSTSSDRVASRWMPALAPALAMTVAGVIVWLDRAGESRTEPMSETLPALQARLDAAAAQLSQAHPETFEGFRVLSARQRAAPPNPASPVAMSDAHVVERGLAAIDLESPGDLRRLLRASWLIHNRRLVAAYEALETPAQGAEEALRVELRAFLAARRLGPSR